MQLPTGPEYSDEWSYASYGGQWVEAAFEILMSGHCGTFHSPFDCPNHLFSEKSARCV